MNGYIYCISNKINDKLYVGKTLLSLDKRFKEHCRDSKSRTKEQRPLYKAMNRYGIDKFFISLLEEVDAERLDERETYWIETLGSYKYGYNATKGGDGKILYGESVFNEDFLSGMTICQIAEKHLCDKSTVRKRLKAQGYKTNANMSKYVEIPVGQFDLNGNHIATFKSYIDAARSLISQGLSSQEPRHLSTNIGRVVQGKRKTCCGFIWRNESC